MNKIFMKNQIPVMAALICVVGILMVRPAAGETPVPAQTVEVLGASAVYGDNVATARDRAIAAGLSSAIERVISEYLPLESRIQNFHVLNETMYGRTEHFIQGYKVLTEARSKSSYRVMVQATVSKEKVIEQLSLEGMMAGEKAMPRILFMVVEQSLDDPEPQYWWGEDMVATLTVSESAMTDVMKNSGFVVLDRKQMAEQISYLVVKCQPEFDGKEIAELGAQLGTDVTIVAKASSEIASNTIGEDIRSFKGTVTARAVFSDSGEEIDTIRQTAVAVNIDAATGSRLSLKKAGMLAGRELSSSILAAWQKELPPPAVVDMIVSGTRNLAHFVMFRRALKETPGVRDILIREMKSDEAILAIDYEGNLDDLAEALILKTFESFGINISEMLENRMKVTLIPN